MNKTKKNGIFLAVALSVMALVMGTQDPDATIDKVEEMIDKNTSMSEIVRYIEENKTWVSTKPTTNPSVKPITVLEVTPKLKKWQSKKTNETVFSTVISSDRTDTVIGLSAGEVKSYSDLACIVRFSPNGIIDVRDYDAYRADVRMTYKKDKKYTFRFDVNLKTHTYSVSVKEENRAYVPIASDYKFRKEQSKVSKLLYISSYSQSSEYTKLIHDNLIYDVFYKKSGVPKYVDIELISDGDTVTAVTDDKGYFKTFLKEDRKYRVVAIENGHRFIQKDLTSKVLTWNPKK